MFEINGGGVDEGLDGISSRGVTKVGETMMKKRMTMKNLFGK